MSFNNIDNGNSSEEQKDELLLTLFGTKPEHTIDIYRSSNKSLYYVIKNTGKIRKGSPEFNVHSGIMTVGEYHPSKLVFTGAQSGNVVMGGVHKTEAYIEEKSSATSKGYIQVETGELSFSLEKIDLSSWIRDRYKRDSWLNSICPKTTILCYDPKGEARAIEHTQYVLANSAMNFYAKTNAISNAVNEKCLPMKECKHIASLINEIITGKFPPDDAELYNLSLSLAEKSDLDSLLTAEKNFELLEDYKDSKEKLKELQWKKHLAQNQANKEAKIKKLKIAIAIILGVSILLTATIVISNQHTKKVKADKYSRGIQYYENGEYEKAIEVFKALDDYQDSADQLEKSKDGIYQTALTKFEQGDFNEAVSDLESIKGYKDTEEILSIADEEAKTYNALIKESNITDELIAEANSFVKSAKYLHVAEFETILQKFNIFANATWQLESGDPTAVCAGRNENNEVTTDLYRGKGWNYFQLYVYYKDSGDSEKHAYYDGKMSDTRFREEKYTLEIMDEKTISISAKLSDGQVITGIYVKQ